MDRKSKTTSTVRPSNKKRILLWVVVAIAVVLAVAFVIFYFLRQIQQPIDTTLTYVYCGYEGAYLHITPELLKPPANTRKNLIVIPLVRLYRYETLSALRARWQAERVVVNVRAGMTLVGVPAFPWTLSSSSLLYRVSGPALIWSNLGDVHSVEVVGFEGIDSQSSRFNKDLEESLVPYAVTFKVSLREGGSFFVVCAGPKAPIKISKSNRSVITTPPSSLTPDAATGLPVLSYSTKVSIIHESAATYKSLDEKYNDKYTIREATSWIGV